MSLHILISGVEGVYKLGFVILITFLVIALAAPLTYSCFSIYDQYAMEVVFGSNEFNLNISDQGLVNLRTLMLSIGNVVTISNDTYVFRYWVNKDILISIYIAPVWINDTKYKSLDIRLESEKIVETIRSGNKPSQEDLDYVSYVMSRALFDILFILVKYNVTTMDQEAIMDLVKTIKLGDAGWNNRLVLLDGKWTPYYEIPGSHPVRAYGCSFTVDPGMVPKEPPKPPYYIYPAMAGFEEETTIATQTPAVTVLVENTATVLTTPTATSQQTPSSSQGSKGLTEQLYLAGEKGKETNELQILIISLSLAIVVAIILAIILKPSFIH